MMRITKVVVMVLIIMVVTSDFPPAEHGVPLVLLVLMQFLFRFSEQESCAWPLGLLADHKKTFLPFLVPDTHCTLCF